MRVEVRFAGFGGQGIIRSGLILSMAACIFSDKNAVQTQSYGPESRGGSCKSEVVISDGEIDFPRVYEPDILVIMSQEAYSRHVKNPKKGAIILVDPNMVAERNDPNNAKIYEIPATEIAGKMGKKIIANVVMLGALTEISHIVDPEAMKNAILQNVPKGTEDLNMAAFEKGAEYGRNVSMQRSAKTLS
ncbi:MAG: 2-oxoacid:ferredoxin oxidoreductase subunit gamma [Candidatus Bathyarchaeota archaeon]|nr:MAG: 2-oxoacid:ferredoxin oxidoreductase subunit gamma [Candidatus Bathyarchaeota archaeon]